MSPTTATLIGAGIVIAINLLTAAFVYGQLTQKVKANDERIFNLESVVSGRDGHGERITRLEAAKLYRAHHGD